MARGWRRAEAARGLFHDGGSVMKRKGSERLCNFSTLGYLHERLVLLRFQPDRLSATYLPRMLSRPQGNTSRSARSPCFGAGLRAGRDRHHPPRPSQTEDVQALQASKRSAACGGFDRTARHSCRRYGTRASDRVTYV
eukprot:6214208-Pleurochrysis_carterae.AAC.1